MAASSVPQKEKGSVEAEHATEAPALPTQHHLRSYLGYVMKRAYLIIQSDAERALDLLDLRITTSSALHIIVENPDISQSQLAQSLSVDRSRAVLLVDELEGRDLINRNKVHGDRRSYALRATLTGRELCEKARKALQKHEDDVFGALDAHERAELRRLLLKIERGDAVSNEIGG